MQVIIDHIIPAREARPDRLRNRRFLPHAVELENTLRPHVNRIRTSAQQVQHRAISELVEVNLNDPGFPAHVRRFQSLPAWRQAEQRRIGELNEKLNLPWSAPTSLDSWTEQWHQHIPRMVEDALLEVVDTRRDLPALLRQRRHDDARPLIHTIERSQTAGLARIRAHPDRTVLETGANWIAWTYLRAFNHWTCRGWGVPRDSPRAEFHSNLAIVPPTVPDAARQQMPTHYRQDRGVQTSLTRCGGSERDVPTDAASEAGSMLSAEI